MNRFLAQGFRAINNLWAILIVGGMWGGLALFGVYAEGASWGAALLAATLIGLPGGVLMAVLVCGYIAVILDIRDLLREIRDQNQGGRNRS